MYMNKLGEEIKYVKDNLDNLSMNQETSNAFRCADTNSLALGERRSRTQPRNNTESETWQIFGSIVLGSTGLYADFRMMLYSS